MLQNVIYEVTSWRHQGSITPGVIVSVTSFSFAIIDSELVGLFGLTFKYQCSDDQCHSTKSSLKIICYACAQLNKCYSTVTCKCNL